MNLSKLEIQHIVELARLDLTEKEMEIYGCQLGDILNYIDQLKEVDTTGVEPTAQVTGLLNVLREDKILEWDEPEVKDALKQAPELEKGQIKVRRVL